MCPGFQTFEESCLARTRFSGQKYMPAGSIDELQGSVHCPGVCDSVVHELLRKIVNRRRKELQKTLQLSNTFSQNER